MIIEKLDGFTADGLGNVVGTEKDLVDGDVKRITNDDKSSIELRHYTPAPASQPKSQPPATTKQQILDQIAVLTSLANQLP